jgi:hypothetical protein
MLSVVDLVNGIAVHDSVDQCIPAVDAVVATEVSASVVFPPNRCHHTARRQGRVDGRSCPVGCACLNQFRNRRGDLVDYVTYLSWAH